MVTVLDKYKKQNPWISILRILLCFAVIQYHYNTAGETILQKYVAVFGRVAVPCFMFISFYFMSGDVKDSNTEKIKNRLLRLYVPILFWNVFNWTLFNAFYIRSGNKESIIGIKALLESLLFTHYPGMPAHLWFLFAQIVVLVLCSILLSFGKNEKEKIVILVSLIVGALILQYTGVNFELFNGANPVITYSLGRCIECVPFAGCGLLYAWLVKERGTDAKDSKWIANIAIATVSLSIAMIAFVADFTPANFGYGGLYPMFISVAICVFTFIIPDVLKGNVRSVLNFIGSCTMGIYCMQGIVGWFLPYIGTKISAIGNRLYIGTLVFDTWIFIVGLAVTTVVRVINSKLKLKWIEWSF